MALNNDLTGQYFGRLKVIERVEDYIEKMEINVPNGYVNVNVGIE